MCGKFQRSCWMLLTIKFIYEKIIILPKAEERKWRSLIYFPKAFFFLELHLWHAAIYRKAFFCCVSEWHYWISWMKMYTTVNFVSFSLRWRFLPQHWRSLFKFIFFRVFYFSVGKFALASFHLMPSIFIRWKWEKYFVC